MEFIMFDTQIPVSKEFIDTLFELYPGYTHIFGPCANKANEGRKHIVLWSSNKRRTISWPKAMMEVKLKRHLLKDEKVDHMDDDPTNDCYENFQILSNGQNVKKGLKRLNKERKFVDFVCNYCTVTFRKRYWKGRKCVYCSKICQNMSQRKTISKCRTIG